MTALGRAIFQASWKVPSLPAASITGVGAAAFGQLLDAASTSSFLELMNTSAQP